MPRKPMPKPPYGSSEVYIRRSTFILLAIHWAIIVLAVPFIVIIQSETLFWYYLGFTLLSTLVLWLATPAHRIFFSKYQALRPCPSLG